MYTDNGYRDNRRKKKITSFARLHLRDFICETSFARLHLRDFICETSFARLHLGTLSVIVFYRKQRNDPNSGVHPYCWRLVQYKVEAEVEVEVFVSKSSFDSSASSYRTLLK